MHVEDRRGGTEGAFPRCYRIRHVLVLGTAMTGKEDMMQWEQIEIKWAAMTRRIRADYTADRIDATGRAKLGLPGRDTPPSRIADSMAAQPKGPESKPSAK